MGRGGEGGVMRGGQWGVAGGGGEGAVIRNKRGASGEVRGVQ